MTIHDRRRLPKMFRTRQTARAATMMDAEILGQALIGLNLGSGDAEELGQLVLDKVFELSPRRPQRGGRPERTQ